METSNNENRRRARRGGIFPYIAFFLAVFTLVTAFLDLSPSRALKSAIRGTQKEWEEREEVLAFLSQVLREGGIQVEGKSFDLSYYGNLPEAAYLSLSNGDGDLSFYSQDDELILESQALLDSPLSADREGAASKIDESALVSQEFPEKEILFLLRAYLALTDPALTQGTLSSAVSRVGNKLFGSAKREKGYFLVEGEEVSATKISYTLEADDFSRGLAAFQKEGEKEEVRDAVLAVFTALNALTGNPTTKENKDAIETFFKGEGEKYDAFARTLESGDSRGEAVFWIRSGSLVGMEWSLSLEGVTASLSLSLGKNIKGSKESCLEWQWQRDGEEAVAFSLSHRMVEDSKKACIREVEWDFCGEEGKIRYSWGKTKGDLGLRVITPEKEINFRGELKEYKKRKKISFVLSAVEENRENRLSSPLTLILTREGKIPAMPAAKGPLFPEGEEKEQLRQNILDRYREKKTGGA